ncbi:hypothetical protein NKH77_02330 [Streptomyces sp. M19]
MRELFVRHLLEPVRFRLLIEAMYAAGFRAFVQLGAGQLGSLIGDTLRGRDHLVVPAHSAHRSGLPQLLRVATALWADGAVPDAAALRPAATPGRRPRTAGPARPRRRHDLPRRAHPHGGRRRAGPPRRAVDGARPSALDTLGARDPLAAEFAALLDDTAALAADVLTAGRRPPRTGRAPARPYAPPAAPATPAARPPATPANCTPRCGSPSTPCRTCSTTASSSSRPRPTRPRAGRSSPAPPSSGT